MKKLTPLFLTLVTALFFYTGCNNDSDSGLTNNNTSGNHSPESPKNPTPADNSTNVPRYPVTLAWVCADPDVGDTVKFDVQMANVNPPDHTLATGLTAASYTLQYLLAADTVFYWRIIAKDNHSAVTTGPVWRFTTGTTDKPE
jgi:hypothetical protein